MNSEQILAWASRGMARGAREGLAARVRCLARPLEQAELGLDFFEAAVDNERGLGRAKVVHVARSVDESPLAPRQRAELSRLRQRTLLELFAMTPGLDPRPLEALFAALKRAGAAAFFAPIISVECDAGTGVFSEISLYSDHGAERLLAPMAAAAGTPTPPARGLAAVGYDFRPGSPARLKLYRDRPWSAVPRASRERRALSALPAGHRPPSTLSLARLPVGGAWEKPRKVYLPFIDWKSPMDVRLVGTLRDACAPGPLRSFLTTLVEAGAGSHVMDYLGCEDGRLEAYFGLPFGRSNAASSAAARSWEEEW